MSIVKENISGKMQEEIWEDRWIHSACEMCYSSCGILVHRVNGIVVKIQGDPDCPHNRGKICAKGESGLIGLYDPNRVKFPLRRTNPQKGIGIDPKWERISWEEALNIITEKLKKVRAEDPRKLAFADWDMVLHDFLHRSWLNAWGIPGPVFLAAYRCGAAMHSATYLTNGTFHNEIDLDYCNYCILFGNQAGFMVGLAPNIMSQKMAEARERGMKLVVVDPLCTNAGAKADEWIPIRPGTDGAMALAMLHVLLNEEKLYDAEFLKKHTNAPYLVGSDGHYLRDKESNKPLVWDSGEGKAKPFDAEVKDYALEGSYIVVELSGSPAFQLLKDGVSRYTPEGVSSVTTVPAETIRKIAQEFGRAARIGSKISIEGVELPYRPAAANYYRGVTARTHGTNQSLAISLLNLVTGAIHVPGGHSGVNLIGPGSRWHPEQEPDGLMVSPDKISHGFNPYTLEVKAPTRMNFAEFLPVGHGSGVGAHMSVREPELFKIPVKPEVMIHCRTNIMMSRENLKDAEETLRKTPFVISIVTHLDETAEFADIVLPDTHYLERTVMFPNRDYISINNITGYWYWGIVQPVVKPAGEARHWWEVLLEIADRVGFLKDFYRIFSYTLLKEPHRLDLNKKYTLNEILDKYAKSVCGSEYGMDWFKEHGYLKMKRKVEERYPFLATRPRLPVYFENYQRAGEKVKMLTESVGIPWDTSDYLAVPDWKPSPVLNERNAEYDLFCINYKTPISYHTISAQNPWLNELAEHHSYYYKILINTETARRKRIKDGDLIWVESKAGKVIGKARVSECIHPEVVGIAGTYGSWAKGKAIARGKGVNHNHLLPLTLDRLDGLSAAVDDCVEVKIYRAE